MRHGRKRKPVALVDLDGTLADFDLAMRTFLAAINCPNECNLPTEVYRARRNLIKSVPGFWENLTLLPRGMHIVDDIFELGFSVHILTKGPMTSTAAWSEKVRWVQKIFAKPPPITITHDKGLVYGRVLVDDWPEYVTRWLRFRPRGVVIMPAQPWNEGYTHPQVLRYRGLEDRPAMLEALQAARDRRVGVR